MVISLLFVGKYDGFKPNKGLQLIRPCSFVYRKAS